MPDSKNKKRNRVIAGTVSATLVALFVVSYMYGELWFRTSLMNALKASTAMWIFAFWPIIVPIVAGAILLFAAYEVISEWNQTPEKIAKWRKIRIISFAAIAFGMVNLVVPGIGLFGSQAYRVGQDSLREISTNVSESNDQHPEYMERSNSVQATRIVNELLNDVSISSTTPAQYSLVNGKPAWCVGGMGRADRWGRKYTTKVVCIDENNVTTRASFNGVIPSIDGKFSTNLRKAIAEAKPGVSVADEDVRFMIKDGSPLMIVSGTIRRGGIHSITLPAGVFVYDVNGKLTYDAEVTSGEYGIAVLPYKVARDLRASLNSRAGYWCASNLNKEKCLKLNTPYESTNTVNGEEQDNVNSENYSEFVLRRADGSIAMVTPLTNYGKGRNITAYLDVNADEVKAGELPRAILYKGVNEVSHRVVVQALTPAYTSDLTWLTEIDATADQATASRIFEITPTKPGFMRLTIGTSTNPQYIVEIDATLGEDSMEFSWCIYTDSSSGQTAKKIECRKVSDGEAPIGTLRGLNLGTNQPNPATPVNPNSDLKELSNEELLQLIKDAAEELANR